MQHKILVLFATAFEAKAVCKDLFEIDEKNKCCTIEYRKTQFTILLGGVGNVNTCFSLTKILSTQSFDLIIQLGIAGSYNQNRPIGSVVQVIEEQFYHLGAEGDPNIETIFDMGFADPNEKPFINGKLDAPNNYNIELPKARSLSVGLCSSTIKSAQNKAKQMNVDIENMEGAACFYVALMHHTPVIQIRSISNVAGDRDKSNWDFKTSLNNLASTFNSVVNNLITSER